MNWQQIAVIVLLAFEVGASFAYDGRPKEGRYSFWLNFPFWMALAYLLWSGGFWS